MINKIGELTLTHYNENVIRVLEENGYILTKEYYGFREDRYIVSVPCEEEE